MSELQDLIDSLAGRLDRAVAIDDQRFRLAAFSSHEHDVDDVRRASIMRREAPAEVVAWLTEIGVQRAVEPVRIAENRALGMRARACVPIRFDGLLLGYMWLIEDDDPLDAEELDLCVTVASDVAAALYRERVLDDEARERERSLVARLVDPRSPDRDRAAIALVDEGLLIAASRYRAITASAGLGGPAANRRSVVLASALERVRRSFPVRATAVGSAGARGTVLVSDVGNGCAPERCREACDALLDMLRSSDAPDEGWRVGLGPVVAELSAVSLSASAAEDAATVAVGLGHGDGVGIWDDLGPWRLLVRLAGDDVAMAGLHDGLAAVERERDGAALVSTVETYLDLGGDAQPAAARLGIHRTSLYGRLRRFERLAGADLRSGDDRLLLHMTLLLRRLEKPPPGAVADIGRPGVTAPHATGRARSPQRERDDPRTRAGSRGGPAPQ